SGSTTAQVPSTNETRLHTSVPVATSWMRVMPSRPPVTENRSSGDGATAGVAATSRGERVMPSQATVRWPSATRIQRPSGADRALFTGRGTVTEHAAGGPGDATLAGAGGSTANAQATRASVWRSHTRKGRSGGVTPLHQR